jgi:putative redox protein
MLAAAAGCTGLDVIEMLRKMRVELTHFDIKIDAELTDEHPKKYEAMKLVYEFKGDDLNEKKIERAVKLSFENYCGVLAMYKSCVPVSYEIKINED